MDDKEIIHEAKKGDSRAFEQLVELYHRRVYAVALMLLRNKEVLRIFLRKFLSVCIDILAGLMRT